MGLNLLWWTKPSFDIMGELRTRYRCSVCGKGHKDLFDICSGAEMRPVLVPEPRSLGEAFRMALSNYYMGALPDLRTVYEFVGE